jgi:hypothetical protein
MNLEARRRVAIPLFDGMDSQVRCRSLEAAMMEPDAYDCIFRLAELIAEATMH